MWGIGDLSRGLKDEDEWVRPRGEQHPRLGGLPWGCLWWLSNSQEAHVLGAELARVEVLRAGRTRVVLGRPRGALAAMEGRSDRPKDSIGPLEN